jgi:hypothetical protein
MARQPGDMGLVHYVDVQAWVSGHVEYRILFTPCQPCLADLDVLADQALGRGALGEGFRASEVTGGPARAWTCEGRAQCGLSLAVQVALGVVRYEQVAPIRPS